MIASDQVPTGDTGQTEEASVGNTKPSKIGNDTAQYNDENDSVVDLEGPCIISADSGPTLPTDSGSNAKKTADKASEPFPGDSKNEQDEHQDQLPKKNDPDLNNNNNNINDNTGAGQDSGAVLENIDEKENILHERPTRYRVKLYRLENQSWEDSGTGHIDPLLTDTGQHIFITSEKTEGTILHVPICAGGSKMYQLQQQTLIVWTDPHSDVDMAISFQESEGCSEVWEKIIEASEKAPVHTRFDLSELNSESSGSLFSSQEDSSNSELPDVSISTLDKIDNLLSAAQESIPTKRKMVAKICQNNCVFVNQLFDIFHMCEDLEDLQNLHHCYEISKNLVLMNDTSILDYLLANENILQLIGMLEYDPKLPSPIPYRKFLAETDLKEPIVLDQDLKDKICQTYRIQYIMDVILPRVLDDNTFKTLTSYTFLNNVEIVTSIQTDKRVLLELFSKLKEGSGNQLVDAVGLLQELCNLSKNLSHPQRIQFYQNLIQQGFFSILAPCLKNPNSSVRLNIVNIMENVIGGYELSSFRKFVMSEEPHFQLFNTVIEAFIRDTEVGVRVQLLDILKTLLDPQNVELHENEEKEQLLTLFYAQFIKKIIEPLNSEVPEQQSEQLPTVVSTYEGACELLSFCINHHQYRIKYFLLGNDVISKVLKLLRSREKHIVLAALRVLRTFVGMKDEFYNRHITKHNLLSPVMDIFQKNGSKYNLLNSAIIELFDFILRSNIKALIVYSVETFEQVFKEITYVDTFQNLIKRYAQLTEPATSGSPSKTGEVPSPSLEGTNKEVVSSQEEEWFLRDEDEDEDHHDTRSKESKEDEKVNPEEQRLFEEQLDRLQRLKKERNANEGDKETGLPHLPHRASVENDEHSTPNSHGSAQTTPSNNTVQALRKKKKVKIEFNLGKEQLSSPSNSQPPSESSSEEKLDIEGLPETEDAVLSPTANTLPNKAETPSEIEANTREISVEQDVDNIASSSTSSSSTSPTSDHPAEKEQSPPQKCKGSATDEKIKKFKTEQLDLD